MKKIKNVSFLYIIIMIIFIIIEVLFNTYFGKVGLWHLLFKILQSTFLCLPICLLAGCGIWFILKIMLIEKFMKETGKWYIYDTIISIIITIIFLSVISPFGLSAYKLSDGERHLFGSRFMHLCNVICDLYLEDTYNINVDEYEITHDTEKISGVRYTSGKSVYRTTYVKFDNGLYIPITKEDADELEKIWRSSESNIITLYKRSGLIAKINEKNF